MQAAEREAKEKKDSKLREEWRLRLHTYLDLLFQKDSASGSAFHGLQVGSLSHLKNSRPCLEYQFLFRSLITQCASHRVAAGVSEPMLRLVQVRLPALVCRQSLGCNL